MVTNLPLHILLAEDDDDDESLFREALKRTGKPAELLVVKNGKELMERLEGLFVLPDVVFLDINMPFKNGIECLREIRHDEHLKEVPVIMLSTTPEKKTVELSYELGANLYIAKPLSFARFQIVLNEALERLHEPRRSMEKFFVKQAE